MRGTTGMRRSTPDDPFGVWPSGSAFDRRLSADLEMTLERQEGGGPMYSTLTATGRTRRPPAADIVPPEKLSACHVVVIGVSAHWQAGRAARSCGDRRNFPGAIRPRHRWRREPSSPSVLAAGPGQTQGGCDGGTLPSDSPRYSHGRAPVRDSADLSAGPWVMPGKELVVFCCVDSITARAMVWESVRDRTRFFVDGRMSAEVIRVLASDPTTGKAYYPTTLFAEEQAVVGSCTAKSTVYTASIAAGLMLSQFTRWLRGLPIDKDVLLNLLSMELVTE